MKKMRRLMPEAYEFNGKLPLKQAIPLGLQHVMAMFVGNLTPLLIITGACGIGAGSEYAAIQVTLLQNAMIIAGIVTLMLNDLLKMEYRSTLQGCCCKVVRLGTYRIACNVPRRR